MNSTLRSTLLGLTALAVSALPSSLVAAEKAVPLGRAATTQQVGFEVYIPIQKRDQMELDLHAMHDPNSATYQKWLTPAQFHARYGATAQQIRAIQNQLAVYGLETTVVNGHHVHVTGSAGAVERALNTPLTNAVYKNGKAVVTATQAMQPPDALGQVNAAVFGLSGMIRMRTHSHASTAPMTTVPENRYSTTGAYFFTDLKQAYSFPSYQTFTGKGVTVATLVDGAYSQADMNKYFAHEKLASPTFQEINVDGGAGFISDSFETNLDFQQAGGMAPDATIIHYNIPDLSDQSIMDGLSQIVSDNKADIVSMSFGGAELYYTPADNDGTDFSYIPRMEDDIMAQGNAQGITFIASSGDSGALSALPVACFPIPAPPNCGSQVASANFPASSPHVTSVGGTNLVTTFDLLSRNSAYVSEEAYADPLTNDIFNGTTSTNNFWGSGGGDSVLFPRPLYQVLVNTGNRKFRTVPDVALHMGGCPGGSVQPCNPNDSADYEVFNNLYYGVIGTSASAPDFAGLTALLSQRTGGRLGNENYYIYTLAFLQNVGLPINVFKTGIAGNNGLYSTTPKGYNRVLGNGTINGVNFLLAPFNPVAGIPLTTTNP